MITAPNPIAPETAIHGDKAPRSPRRPANASNGAAAANRTAVNQPGVSHASESFESGTLRPHRTPAAAREQMAARF